ncbi:MAG: type VI secretion system baseplate subunit TssG [Bacteroidetes bacterium]|jgi:type VI secretion system protein ImpH|nr:type VI secretion system baseplate subunit TssG [Bacteroidota bacterium]
MDVEERTATAPVDPAVSDEARAPSDAGSRGPNVYAQLFREGYRFNFYTAVRLLERYYDDAPTPGKTTKVRRERIRLRPSVDLAFPPSDVKSIERTEMPSGEEGAEVCVTFLGLYGIDSPLPIYFYEELNTEAPETLPLRDFLDIFNHRFYSFYYDAWKKYRPGLHYRPSGQDDDSDRFLSVAGLSTPRAADQAPVRRMRMAGLAGYLAGPTRTAQGLQYVLTDLLDGPGVRVIENVPRWVRIKNRPKLAADAGVGAILGETATIGERVYDCSGKFRVELGPLSFDDFQSFLPGHEGAQTLDYLVRLYAPDYLDYDVKLRLRTPEIVPAQLGNRKGKLGKNVWLGRPEGVEGVTDRIVHYD